MPTGYQWDRHLERTYGIDEGDYAAILDEQGGGCAICGTQTRGKRGYRLAVDHCHVTGEVRGLLCTRCNSEVAAVEARGMAIVQYLLNPPARTVLE